MLLNALMVRSAGGKDKRRNGDRKNGIELPC